MRNVLTILFALLLSISGTFADTIANPGGNGPLGMTCTYTAIPATSTLVTLTNPSSYITIVNGSSTTTLYVNAVSPAAATSFPILPNSSFSYAGVPLASFYVFGSAASGSYGVFAH